MRRNSNQKGFTLIELLIVIAIIGILAAVLIPNLLAARERAFDTAAQTCLKEIATNEEMAASIDPWEYSAGSFAQDAAGAVPAAGANAGTNGISSCANVVVTEDHPAAVAPAVAGVANYGYDAFHTNGGNIYTIEVGAGVTHVAAR